MSHVAGGSVGMEVLQYRPRVVMVVSIAVAMGMSRVARGSVATQTRRSSQPCVRMKFVPEVEVVAMVTSGGCSMHDASGVCILVVPPAPPLSLGI